MATKYLAPSPKFRCTDQNGVPLAGGFLTAYVAGTTTIAETYSNGSGTANSSVITLDARGECNLWLTAGIYYDLRATNSVGVLQYTQNRVSGVVAPSSYMASLMTEASLSGVFDDTIGLGGTFTGTLNLYNAALNYAADVSIVSSATTNIGAAASNNVTVTPDPTPDTYWDSSFKSPIFTLSEANDRLATVSGVATWGVVLGAVGHSTGKRYFEVSISNAGAGGMMIGVANQSVTLTTYLGFDADGWTTCYNTGTGNPVKDYHNNVTNALVPNSLGVCIIGVALDMDAGEVRCYQNNVTVKTAGAAVYSGLSGTLYPALAGVNTNDYARLRLLLSEFTYSPPSGYSAWST